MAKKITRASSSVWLIGGTEDSFRTSKLPSRGEVLKVLFHYHNDEEMSLKDSVDKTVSLLLSVWEMARIPTKAENHIIEHIRKLHAEWQGLKKSINRQSSTNKKNQQVFQDSLDELFDIAHRDAMILIKVEEDRLFLAAQREKGRRGTMAGIDRNLAAKEQRVIKRKTAAASYSRKVKAQSVAVVDLAGDRIDDTLFSESESGDETDECDQAEPQPSTSKSLRSRGTVDMITSEVAAALDRTNTSHRKASHIFSALAADGKFRNNPDELIISPSAIRRARIKHRENFASEIKATFDPKVPLVLHWDGKLLPDFTGSERGHVDRLPILVSGCNVVKLLSVPKLKDGKAVTMSQAIVDSIDEWGLRGRISGLCFDTTASNTGAKGGVCLLLEKEIGREMLNLACRHHISEILLGNIFCIHDVSKSPNMELFGHFKDFWPRIDQSSFSTALEDESMAVLIAPWKDDVIQFVSAQLENNQPRDDYCELLELTIIFLGGIPPRGIRFRYPGAIHRARWMARAIYAIKMCLFRNQYKPLKQRKTRGLSHSDQIWDHLKEVSLFVAEIYVKYWFESPLAASAPRNDLNLLRALSAFRNKEIAKVAMKAFNRHLWYLSELLVGFGFFDDAVSVEEKRLMVLALREKEGSQKPLKRILPLTSPETMQLHDFVTTSTLRAFQLLGLSKEFLNCDPSEWGYHDGYRHNQEVVRHVKVINDLAERGVAMIQQFNSSLTRNEEQKQYLLQVVEDHRRKYPKPTKAVNSNQ